MDTNQEKIIDFAARRAGEVWRDMQRPYLLSLLSPELKAHDIDYKAVLGPLKLKEFLQSSGSGKLKLILHPTQRSKVGIIPYDKEFAYEATEIEPVTEAELVRSNPSFARPLNARFVVMNFLQLLATLPKDEAEKVHIPTSVLAMLIKAR